MLDLESRGPGSIPTRGGVIFCFKFYNPNLHNIARSDRIRFKIEKPECATLLVAYVRTTVLFAAGASLRLSTVLYCTMA